MSGTWDLVTAPLKTASDLAKGMMELRDLAKFGEVVVKLQDQILAAQRGAMAGQSREHELLDQLRDLKSKLAEVEGWEAEKKRYALEELPPGVFVLALRPDAANGEPPHKICPTCYQRGKKSLLHASETKLGRHSLSCRECGTQLWVGHSEPIPSRRRVISYGL